MSLLEARRLSVGYGGGRVVRDLDLEVAPGEVVALLGPNGAGKTTTVLTLAGELKPVAGAVSWLGSERQTPLHKRARQGLSFVTEERSVFARLTTGRNLKLAQGCDLDAARALFPELEPLWSRRAGLLSGGEQQMLTLARALSRPTKLLLADELSLGLAPQTVGRLMQAVRQAADRGMGALVVEQHVRQVLEIADRVYVLRQGLVRFEGTGEEARKQIDVIEAHYLTTGPAGPEADATGTEARPVT